MTSALQVGERRLRHVAVSWAALRQADACQYLCICGTETKGSRVLGKLNSRLRAWLSRGRGLVAAAGVTNRLWEISDIVGVLEDWEVHKRAPSQKVPVINFLFAARTFFQDGRMLSFCCLT